MKEKEIALVTGASRGIGRAVARALAGRGYLVLLNFRSRAEEAEATRKLIEGEGGAAELWPFDVADGAASETALSNLIQSHSRLDVLVHNAGVRDDALLVFMKAEQWDRVISTNLDSFFNVVRPVVKQMALQRKGRVVCIASTAAQTGVEGQTNYSAAKAGLIGAAKALAREVAKRGVTVNVVAPGFIETEMTAGVQRDQALGQIPAGRFGQPEEVAAAAAFLCSAEASYVTGAVLNVNGGVYL